jgi:hypothetical protein
MRKIAVPLALLAALPITAAHAYIGPGAGAGAIAVVFGILSSIFLAFVAIVWYPIKRLFKRRKATAKPPGAGEPVRLDDEAPVTESGPAARGTGTPDPR